jgi:hypothetical protein
VADVGRAQFLEQRGKLAARERTDLLVMSSVS